MSEHSSLQIRIELDYPDDGHNTYYVYDEAYNVIGQLDGPQSPENDARAAFIARAVNSHQDLVDALEGLLQFVAEHTDSGEPVPRHTVEHVRSYAALAKARGET